MGPALRYRQPAKAEGAGESGCPGERPSRLSEAACAKKQTNSRSCAIDRSEVLFLGWARVAVTEGRVARLEEEIERQQARIKESGDILESVAERFS